MKLSIAVCTHNEGQYIEKLLTQLRDFIDGPAKLTNWEYEIVVVDDYSDDDMGGDILKRFHDATRNIVWCHALLGDFSAHKNFMNSKCTGDWILNLDADEYLPNDVLFNIPAIIESNPEVDAYWLPRVNTVEGLTIRHITKWFWTVDRLDGFRTATMRENLSDDEYGLLYGYALIVEEKDGVITYDQPIVAFPDPQMRLYKNSPDIKWVNKVHEKLTGYKNFSNFPYTPDYAIRHEKDIKRQEQQNSFYETL